MGIAQKVADNLSQANNNVGQQPQITFPGYKRALAAALSGGEYPLSPGAQGTLDAVRADLQRATGGSNAVRTNGSPTAYNLTAPGWLGEKLYGDNLLKPGGLVAKIPGVKGVIDASRDTIQQKLANALLNPDVMAGYLASPQPSFVARATAPIAKQLPQLSSVLLPRNEALAAALRQQQGSVQP
jgi:hypothetical protein